MNPTASQSAGPSSDPEPRPSRGGWSFGLAVRAAQVRLRFVAVLVAAFLVVGRWDDLRDGVERLTRATGSGSGEAGQSAVSGDTEYFCPMDPGVLSDWPGKCGICNMGLVRRKRGEAVPLPSGVVARMQFSPYRVQLAGVGTSPVDYRPLMREMVLIGVVGAGGRTVLAEALDRDLPQIAAGQLAEVVADALPGRPRFAGKVAEVRRGDEPSRRRVSLELAGSGQVLDEGAEVTVRVRQPVAGLEPFRSQPADPPPLRQGEPRSAFVCPEHAEVLRDAPGRCPVDGKSALEAEALRGDQRLRWWCPMHPAVTADRAGGRCDACGGMILVPRVVTYRPPGQVLAVPESAVVDTGARRVVYVERMPGMFDGVEVELGPRCGDFYPVVRGLDPGQRAATAGAFLIDAETRLNPALASAYFGSGSGSGRTSRAGSSPATPAPSLAPARADEKALAESQRVCPVTRKPLGSMGAPVLVVVKGRSVLVCCEGCVEPLKAAPEKFLARLDASGPSPSPAPAARP